jgi:hypothetical protein
MRPTPVLALTALLVAACVDAAPGGGDDGGPGPAGGQVWTGDSQRISIRSFGYWDGSSGYERARGELTPAQLELLAHLEVREPVDSCSMDLIEHEISIVDGAGVSHQYYAKESDDTCQGNESTAPLIAMASLQPFLDTFTCISASDTREGAFHDVPLVVHPGDGCLHGLFMDGRGAVVRLELQVATPGALTLSTESCRAFATRLTLFDVDGTTVLGEGAPPPACAGDSALTYQFAAAGTYFIEVTSTNEMCGDLLLRVR